MKVILLALTLIINISYAQTAFQCKKDGTTIERGFAEETDTLLIKNKQNKIQYNLHIDLASEEGRGYQHRYGYYNQLAVYAIENLPYMPEFMMLIHMSRANKAYKKGFKVFEGESKKTVILKQMYCEALIKAIMNF